MFSIGDMKIWFSPGKMGSLGSKLVEETFNPYGVKGFGHIYETRAGQPPLARVSVDLSTRRASCSTVLVYSSEDLRE
jgi:hypothetical protein